MKRLDIALLVALGIMLAGLVFALVMCEHYRRLGLLIKKENDAVAAQLNAALKAYAESIDVPLQSR